MIIWNYKIGDEVLFRNGWNWVVATISECYVGKNPELCLYRVQLKNTKYPDVPEYFTGVTDSILKSPYEGNDILKGLLK